MAKINVIPGISNGSSSSGGSGTNGPAPGSLHAQTKIRIEQIARYRIAGIRDFRIAEILKLTPATLKFITEKVEYKEVEEALLIGHLTEMDLALAGHIDPLRQEIRNAVPAALRCLVDAVTQRRDLRTALAASVEILKRDPDRVAPDLEKSSRSDGNDPLEYMKTIPQSMLEETARSADIVAIQLTNKRTH
jgi:DNA-binding CsgD family transcriptional regulator